MHLIFAKTSSIEFTQNWTEIHKNLHSAFDFCQNFMLVKLKTGHKFTKTYIVAILTNKTDPTAVETHRKN